MIDEILCTARDDAVLIALREAGTTVELHVEPRTAATLVGGVHLGRITRIVPAMGAAFVDVGFERAGFLPLSTRDNDAARSPQEETLHEGAAVIVQVAKDPQSGKGAALTRSIALPGRHLVYAPRQQSVVLSRRLTDEAERARLSAAMAEIARPDEGFILRTAAEGATPDALARDAEELRAAWAAVKARAAGSKPPLALWQEPSPLVRVLRDRGHENIRRIVTDDEPMALAARDYCRQILPALATRIDMYRDSIPLFDRTGVRDEIEAALTARVPLPSGGFLIIEPTQTLVAIDVNTGRHGAHLTGSASPGQAETILAANLEAAQEIVRQIRLRNLSGLIVVDFVHMTDSGHQVTVLETLRDGLSRDPVFARLGGFTPLGLVEIARRRMRPALHELLTAECRACDGRGRVTTPSTTSQGDDGPGA